MKKILILAMIAVLIIPGLVLADTVNICMNNRTAQINTTISVISGGSFNTTTISENMTCQYGCDNLTGGINRCRPDPADPNIFSLVPALVLFFLGFMMLYAGIHLKEYKVLQLLFLGMALFFMITNAWYAQQGASKSVSDASGAVLSQIYFAMIIVMIVVIFIFIFYHIKQTAENVKKRKTGMDF